METTNQDTLCPQCGQSDCTCQSGWENSINAEVAKLPRQSSPDFTVENHGTIFLLRPITPAAQNWIDEHLASDRLTFGDAVAIEHRFIANIVAGIRADGLEVR